MGCGLRKIRQTEDSSPGKIYSTLKRPQVETKIGVAYTYCHLDFLVGKEGTSTLCLSSVRELPSQLKDLYQQGFVLTAVHPFVHPCGPEPASVPRQLYRAVLTKLPESSEKSPADFEPYHLKLEECLSADHTPTPEHIQGYVKKQIQDAADQGIMFAGFIQEPAGLHPRVSARADGGEASLSLHSSPSSLRGSELTASPSHQGDPDQVTESGPEDWASQTETEDPKASGDAGGDALSDGTSIALTPEPHEGQENTPIHNNNKAKDTESAEKAGRPPLSKSGAELFGLFNYPGGQRNPLKYYTVKVPLRVQQKEEGARAVEANWLDHMTQHFNSGASLVDGYFHLGNDNDQPPKVIDSVFIFQEGDSNASTTYDAIVVEQWTVIDGVQVKSDYIPLLQSLASFGWKLTCVLPTPVVKTNSDGSLSTKQIVFLQRPALPLKRKQSKKLIFRTRNKTAKNSVKDAPKNKKKKSTATEKELDDPSKIQDGAENDVAEENSKGMNKKKGKNEGRNGERDGVEMEDRGEEVVERDREVRGELGTKIDQEEKGVEVKQEGSEGRKVPDSTTEVKKEEMGNEEMECDPNTEMKVETEQTDLPGVDRTEEDTHQQHPPSAEESEPLAESDI
ncbi:raftlin-like isoform X3 [Colossoma macropomum]|uniref:raftlin-like isoform X3 n=1 Tax=Colossoma macropomum TaxID=42526 RepID=UPI00186515F7|nr:raftlin-like isoform X3 [Colossoma macropomum]